MTPDHLALSLAVLAGMSVVTYATRAGGVWIMGFVPLTDRLTRFLRHLASSVVVSVLVAGAAKGDLGAKLAIAASLGLMALTRNAMLSIAAGIAVAAATRALVTG